jgi:hypothetical protein
MYPSYNITALSEDVSDFVSTYSYRKIELSQSLIEVKVIVAGQWTSPSMHTDMNVT